MNVSPFLYHVRLNVRSRTSFQVPVPPCFGCRLEQGTADSEDISMVTVVGKELGNSDSFEFSSINTVVGGYSDTLGDGQKCHYNRLSL